MSRYAHNSHSTSLLCRPFWALMLALSLLSAVGASAQTPSLDDSGPTVLPELNELATFQRLNGNAIFFGVGDADDDLVYMEIGRGGTDVAFRRDERETLLDRYLALAPADAGVPRVLVANDLDGMGKIGRREIVETAGHHQLDLPFGDEGSTSEWACGANDTKANFEAQFCSWNFPPTDLVVYCDSQRWWNLIRQNYRKTMESVTAYCGGTHPILGFGALAIHSEWQNDGSGWAWVEQALAPLGGGAPADWVYMLSSSNSAKWRRAQHQVFQLGGAYLGTVRAVTAFSN